MNEKCSMCGSSRNVYMLGLIVFVFIAVYAVFQVFAPPVPALNPALNVLTNENFRETVSSGVVLVDFWASWCGPCKSQIKVLNGMAEKKVIPDGVKFCMVNVDEQPELATKFNIQSIPTIIVFRNGKVSKVMNGVNSEKELLEALK